MIEIQRYSPVSFNAVPKKTEKRDNWTIVLEYEGEDSSNTPFIIDLSHRTRFDVQDSSLSSIKPFGITIPKTAGQSIFENDFLVNRMNRTQASLWHLSGKSPEMPEESAYTDVTESTMFVALIGEKIFKIAEKLTTLDFLDPGKKLPFLFQGPLCHVPCQIVTLKREGKESGFLFTCSRGYGMVMTHAVMEAGKEFGLKAAGENFFRSWLKNQ